MQAATRQTMYDKFQPWVLATYGDSAKTKTITMKKARRIVKLLQAREKEGGGGGAEPAGSEGAKFRLWVKSKGLSLRPGPGEASSHQDAAEADTRLYLPTGTEQSGDGKVQFVFKRVAVVEKFFDIIYSVHVESSSEDTPHLRGRAGKHCGQKRTYRAIADQFAFIPREAISRFLTFCSECQRKQPGGGARRLGPTHHRLDTEQQLDADRDGPLFYKPPLVTPPATPPQLSVAEGGVQGGPAPAPGVVTGEGGSCYPDLSLPITSTYLRQLRRRDTSSSLAQDAAPVPDMEDEDEDTDQDLNIQDTEGEDSSPGAGAGLGAWPPFSSRAGIQVSALGQLLGQQNGNIASMSPVRSDMSRDESIVDDASSVGNKEDDDDDEDDGNDDEKFEGFSGDPERLKAFNMFVRLFVDENLDRHVPISKQPKEKIQAIMDSCTRQFPEYAERARKRIRTYLKSCRRTKRSREQAGLDINNRPTPPHLTSVLAEQMLARACENEAENAKRMRMGLEPVSQSLPAAVVSSAALDSVGGAGGGYRADQLVSLLAQAGSCSGAGGGHNGVPARPSAQPPFSNGHQEAGAGAKRSALLSHKLNGTEITAVRQLITGYRESAAFLLRSADELENLLQLQPKL